MSASLDGDIYLMDGKEFVARWQAAGPHILARNHILFRELLEEAKALARAGDYAYAASWCAIAATQAFYEHGGIFASPELEWLIDEIGQAALGAATIPRGTAPGESPRRILHVATAVQTVGGHSRTLWRWIATDRTRVHSVALVQQRRPVPGQLVDAVRASAGRIHILSDRTDNILKPARNLRTAAAGADLIVLHIGCKDIVPLLAFSGLSGRPLIALVDHSDHAFWVGASIADVVISLRGTGRALACKRRGLDPARSALLPIPLGRIERNLSRQEARKRLGLGEDGLLLVSVARSVKYRTVDGTTYADAVPDEACACPYGGARQWPAQRLGFCTGANQRPDTGISGE
jgi:hypothetical protein